MFKIIEELIRDGCTLTIEEEIYFKGLYIAFDDPFYCTYEPLATMIERATSRCDVEVVEYHETLRMIEEKYPDYPFVISKTLEEGMKIISEKAKRWKNYEREEKIRIYQEIVDIEQKLRKEFKN